MKMASLKNARPVNDKGRRAIWGQLPDITHKTDKFGLGFTTGAQRSARHARIGRPPLYISNQGVNAIEDSEEDSDINRWIHPTTNSGLNNWTVKDFIPISFVTQ